MKVGVTAVLAVVLHVVLGWAWTPLAGLTAGLWQGKGGWWVGGAAVGASWLCLVGYSALVAPEPTMRLATILGSMAGEIPNLLVLASTVAIGVLLGTTAGGLGTRIRLLLDYKRTR